MKPATLLPWRQTKVLSQFLRCEVSARGNKVAACENEQDAAYIAHACNYYPHLAAMLRDLIVNPDVGSYGATMARAAQLLESCGEAKTVGGGE